MRLLVTLFRLCLFLLALWFALKNTGIVKVTFLSADTATEMPLIVVMLGCFGMGTLFGLLAMLPGTFQRRRELALLKRQIRTATPVSTTFNPVPDTDVLNASVPDHSGRNDAKIDARMDAGITSKRGVTRTAS